MREVDRRSKYSRRIFLQGAADGGAGRRRRCKRRACHRGCVGRRCDRAGAGDPEDPGEGRARYLSARFPGRRLLHHRDQAVGRQGREGSGGQDACSKTASSRLDQDARDRHKAAYAQVPWEADRVVLLQGIEQTDFFKKHPLAISWSRSTTRKSCGRSSATRAPPPSMAATSSAVSTTSTGCRKSDRTSGRTSVGRTSHGKIRSE